ncbi:MAG: hypothetical protein ABII90_07490 [Bacteroidota bacterium]
MEQLIVSIDNKSNANLLMQLVEKLSFVKAVKTKKIKDDKSIPKGTFTKKSFLEMCGIWEGSDITAEQIREKAWRKIQL